MGESAEDRTRTQKDSATETNMVENSPAQFSEDPERYQGRLMKTQLRGLSLGTGPYRYWLTIFGKECYFASPTPLL